MNSNSIRNFVNITVYIYRIPNDTNSIFYSVLLHLGTMTSNLVFPQARLYLKNCFKTEQIQNSASDTSFAVFTIRVEKRKFLTLYITDSQYCQQKNSLKLHELDLLYYRMSLPNKIFLTFTITNHYLIQLQIKLIYVSLIPKKVFKDSSNFKLFIAFIMHIITIFKILYYFCKYLKQTIETGFLQINRNSL